MRREYFFFKYASGSHISSFLGSACLQDIRYYLRFTRMKRAWKCFLQLYSCSWYSLLKNILTIHTVAYMHGHVFILIVCFKSHSKVWNTLLIFDSVRENGACTFAGWKKKDVWLEHLINGYKSTFTFFNFAAPAPERMASIRACLASPRLPAATAEDFGAAADSWVGGGGGGGWAGAGGMQSFSAWGSSAFCKDSSAFLKLCSSSEANEEICSWCIWKEVISIKHD